MLGIVAVAFIPHSYFTTQVPLHRHNRTDIHQLDDLAQIQHTTISNLSKREFVRIGIVSTKIFEKTQKTYLRVRMRTYGSSTF